MALVPSEYGTPLGVTFLINTYNHSASIRECLNGVFDQQLGGMPWEIVVVDDGSDDATPDIIKAILDAHDGVQRRYVQFQRAGGVACRQHGFDVANYRLVLMLGGDFILCDPTLVRQMVERLGEEVPFVSLYGPHGGMGTLYRRSMVAAVGGFHLGFNRFGSGFRDDSDLHYLLQDNGWTGCYLPDLRACYRHDQPRVRGVRGALGYARHRVAVHQLDPLLFRRHPTRFATDFRLIGRLSNPVDDFKRATGLWQPGGRVELSSPQGVTLVSGDTLVGRVVAVLGGLAYTLAVHAARVRGSITYRTLLF